VTLGQFVLPENVFWVVTGYITLGARASITGQLLSGSYVTMGAKATVVGRIFCTAAVTMSSNHVTTTEIGKDDVLFVD
jgi:hypothetical protein